MGMTLNQLDAKLLESFISCIISSPVFFRPFPISVEVLSVPSRFVCVCPQLRLKANNLGEVSDGTVVIPSVQLSSSSIEVNKAVFGVKLNGLVVDGYGPLKITLHHMLLAKRIQSIRFSG